MEYKLAREMGAVIKNPEPLMNEVSGGKSEGPSSNLRPF